MNPERIVAVKKSSIPKNLTGIRSFLGLTGYYRRFIQNFSLLAVLISKLTKKNEKFVRGKEQNDAFELFKEKLCSFPVLIHFDNTKPVE